VASLTTAMVLMFAVAFILVVGGWRDAVEARQQAEAAERETEVKAEALKANEQKLEANLYASQIAWAERELSDNNPVRAVTVVGDGMVTLWDAQTGKADFNFYDHKDWVLGVAFSPDGRWLASCGKDQTVKIYDLQNRKMLKSLTAHMGWVTKVKFSPDGRQLV